MTLVTPAQMEKRLVDLSKEVDEAHEELVRAEHRYAEAKSKHEIGLARARMEVAKDYQARGEKATVQEKEDAALLLVPDLVTEQYVADAVVRAARSNKDRVRVQTDLARSVSANVRSAIDLS